MTTQNKQFFLVFAAIILIFELLFLNNDSGWIELLILAIITSFLATLLKSWLEKKIGKNTVKNGSNK